MRDLAVTLVAELILASSASSPSPPQGNTPAQGGVTSLLPARVFYGRSGTALLVLFLTENQLLPLQLATRAVPWLPLLKLFYVRALPQEVE